MVGKISYAEKIFGEEKINAVEHFFLKIYRA